jgi:hypothetical protein
MLSTFQHPPGAEARSFIASHAHPHDEGQVIELGWRADNMVDLLPIDYLELIG